MSALEAELRAFLLADPSVASLVGGRIYPLTLPQGSALPAVLVRRISTSRRGDLRAGDSSPLARVQLGVWSDTYLEAKAVAERLRALLEGYRGVMGERSIQSVQAANETDLFNESTGKYGVALDLLVRFAS